MIDSPSYNRGWSLEELSSSGSFKEIKKEAKVWPQKVKRLFGGIFLGSNLELLHCSSFSPEEAWTIKMPPGTRH